MKFVLVILALFLLFACPALSDDGSLADIVSGMDFGFTEEEAVSSEYYTETETEAGLLCRILVEFGEDRGYVRAAWLMQDGAPLRETVTFEIRTGHDGRDPAGQDTADAVALALEETASVYSALHGMKMQPVFCYLLPTYAGDALLEDAFLTIMMEHSDSWLAQNEWTCVLITDDDISDMLDMGGVMLLELEDGALEANTRGGNAAVVLQRLDELPEEYELPETEN